MFDNNEANNRIQIFGTVKDVERIMVGDELMCDGTFKVVLSLFCQLFTIMAKKYGKWHPCLFCLTQHKTQAAYEAIWENIVRYCLKNDVEINENCIVHVDFEKAIVNAIKKFLPNAQIMHCRFHLGQSVCRKVQSLGLTTKYRNDETFRANVLKLVALTFIEPENVLQEFEILAVLINEVQITLKKLMWKEKPLE